MRIISRLLGETLVIRPNATPKDPWLKTKTPGIYVRPEETDGRVWVFSDKSSSTSRPSRRKTHWDSRRDPSQLAEVDLHDRKGVALPGLQIIPEEIKDIKSNIMRILWERENLPGIEFSFRPTKPKEPNGKYFNHQRRTSH
jgi:hypothetical protein